MKPDPDDLDEVTAQFLEEHGREPTYEEAEALWLDQQAYVAESYADALRDREKAA